MNSTLLWPEFPEQGAQTMALASGPTPAFSDSDSPFLLPKPTKQTDRKTTTQCSRVDPLVTPLLRLAIWKEFVLFKGWGS